MSGKKRFHLNLTEAKQLEMDLKYMKAKYTFLNNRINQQCANSELTDVLSIIRKAEQILSERSYIDHKDDFKNVVKIKFHPLQQKINYKHFQYRLNEDLQYMEKTYVFINNQVNEERAKKELDNIYNFIEECKKINDKKQFTYNEISRNFLQEFENLEQKFRDKIDEYHKLLEEKEVILSKAKSAVKEKLNVYKEEFDKKCLSKEIINWSKELSRATQMEIVDRINRKIDQKIQLLEQEIGRRIRLDTFKQALDKCNEYDEIEETTEKENIILKASKKEKHGIRTDTFVFTLDNLDVVDSDFEKNENICSGTAQKVLDYLYDFGLVNEQASVDCQTIYKTLKISQTKTKDNKETKETKDNKQNKSKRTNYNKTQNSLKRGA